MWNGTKVCRLTLNRARVLRRGRSRAAGSRAVLSARRGRTEFEIYHVSEQQMAGLYGTLAYWRAEIPVRALGGMDRWCAGLVTRRCIGRSPSVVTHHRESPRSTVASATRHL